jgi:DNA polymerase elongation subunit (family B)
MKLNQETIKRIIHLKEQKLPSRYIASIVGCGKTTVNNVYNSYLLNKVKEVNQGKKLKVLVFDIENEPDTALIYGRRKINVSEDQILDYGRITHVGYSFMNEYTTNVIALTSDEHTEKELLEAFVEVYNQADIVSGHNLKRFDIKKLNARLVVNGLEALQPKPCIDTLSQARKHFLLPNYKLDTVCRYLGIGKKSDQHSWDNIKAAMNNDEQASEQIAYYCGSDVELTKELFLVLAKLEGFIGMKKVKYSDLDLAVH